MFRHNLLLIYRNFKRFRSTFFINLIGLSAGLACSLLIYLWVNDELSIDRFHEKDTRLFQVMQSTAEAEGVIGTGPGTPGILAKALAEEMPEIEYVTAFVPPNAWENNGVITVGEKRIKVDTEFADKDFFNVFSYKLIHGDKDKVLSDKKGAAIAGTLAMKLFNTTENIIGKEIEWSEGEKKELFVISGVFESPSSNSTNRFDILLYYDLFLKERPWLQTWNSSDPRTCVVLREGVSVEQFNDKIADFTRSKDKNSNATLFAQRYSDRYLHGHYENGKLAGGRIEYVRLFSIIALFILAIACINYMNLSTAKAAGRIKDVGIKKAIGASRKALVYQYLGESMLITFGALAIALLMTDLLLSPFNLLTGKKLALSFDPHIVLPVLGVTIVTGLLAGSYPALYLSKFSPAKVLKGKLTTAVGEVWARKGLVVFQFALSVILIVSVIVAYKQIAFVQSKNIGYQRNNVAYFNTEKVSDAFMSEIKNIPGVLNAARFYHDLTGNHGGTYALDWEGKNPDDLIDFGNLEVGYDLIETMGFEMAEGKSFSRDFGSIDQIIFNEAAIEKMGLKDPIGKTVNIWEFKRQIVGVVKNFHFESLHEEVKPCFFFLVPMIDNIPSRIMVKIQAGTEKATLERLQKFYKAHNPGLPFEYRFVDDDYQQLYASEQRVATLSEYFAGLAILISALGLFGLAAFTAERRLKEIGIRKVLGSGVFGIVVLLSRDFTKMVLISITIALPVSYLLVTQWLDRFAYKTTLEFWYFAGAGILALAIAWLTVSIQTMKAARINPIECLKDE